MRLALAIVFRVSQNFKNVFGLLLRDGGVVKVFGETTLKPVSVDVQRVDRLRLAGIFAQLKNNLI
jgi:hypothetical protein